MVFLAITSYGLAQALRTATANDSVWCGSDAISEADYADLQQPHVSRFIYPLGDRILVDDAVATIEEHHPGHTVWIEAAAAK